MKREILISYHYFEQVTNLLEADQAFIQQARTIAKNAHAPYSQFFVGAAVLLKNGQVVLGSNQENIAFPSGLCAERVALFFAGANYAAEEIEKIFIVANGDLIAKDAVLSPCGSCRQVMLESQNRQKELYKIYLVGQDDSVHVFDSIYDLMPLAFGKQD